MWRVMGTLSGGQSGKLTIESCDSSNTTTGARSGGGNKVGARTAAAPAQHGPTRTDGHSHYSWTIHWLAVPWCTGAPLRNGPLEIPTLLPTYFGV